MRLTHPARINLEYLSAGRPGRETATACPSQRPDGLVSISSSLVHACHRRTAAANPALSAERDALQASADSQGAVLLRSGWADEALLLCCRDGARAVSSCFIPPWRRTWLRPCRADPRPAAGSRGHRARAGSCGGSRRRPRWPGCQGPADFDRLLVLRPEFRAGEDFRPREAWAARQAGLADLPAGRERPPGKARRLAGALSRPGSRPCPDPGLEPARDRRHGRRVVRRPGARRLGGLGRSRPPSGTPARPRNRILPKSGRFLRRLGQETLE